MGPVIRQVKIDQRIEAGDLVLDADWRLDANEESIFFVLQYQNGYQQARIIVELKKEGVDQAVQQCMLYMLRSFELNNDQLPVYGFCTDGCEWNIIRYNGKEFKILFKRIVVFPGMDILVQKPDGNGKMVEVEEHKDFWLKNHSSMVGLVYTCLTSQVIRARQFEDERRKAMEKAMEDMQEEHERERSEKAGAEQESWTNRQGLELSGGLGIGEQDYVKPCILFD